MISENHRALTLRINEAETAEALQRVEQSAERVYEAGCLTPDEYESIDTAIMEKLTRLD